MLSRPARRPPNGSDLRLETAPGRVHGIRLTMRTTPEAAKPPVANEGIKAASHFLRGTIARDVADTSTGAISEENGQLTKFHGLYLQDDRDVRNALKKAGQEKAFAFMLRVRLPGGRCTTPKRGWSCATPCCR